LLLTAADLADGAVLFSALKTNISTADVASTADPPAAAAAADVPAAAAAAGGGGGGAVALAESQVLSIAML
jgi:hypothetical protein